MYEYFWQRGRRYNRVRTLELVTPERERVREYQLAGVPAAAVVVPLDVHSNAVPPFNAEAFSPASQPAE